MKELEKLIDEIDNLPLDNFEKTYLIPRVIENLKFYRESFKKILPICDKEENALIINNTVRQFVLAETNTNPSNKVSEPGKEYLEGVKKLIASDWLPEFDKILKEFPDANTVKSRKDLLKLAQLTQQVSAPLLWCRHKLLSYSLRFFVNIIKKESGDVVLGAPTEIEILAYPFKGILDEMETSVRSLDETMALWRQSRQTKQESYISYKTALEQTREARLLNIFQVLMIIFTIVLTINSNELMDFFKNLFGH